MKTVVVDLLVILVATAEDFAAGVRKCDKHAFEVGAEVEEAHPLAQKALPIFDFINRVFAEQLLLIIKQRAIEAKFNLDLVFFQFQKFETVDVHCFPIRLDRFS